MPEEKLQTKVEGTVARPAFIPAGDTRGTEHITKDDIQMPRLGLAQGLSPQVQDGDPKRIPDLKVGMLFNNLTNEIIPAPVEFTVIRADRPRYVEFIPREQGGGIRDFDVPAHDPRTQFTRDAQGKSVNPVATKFYDFIILMLPVNGVDPGSNLIALSFKSTGLKVARQLNGLLKMRNAPSFACKFKLTTGMDRNAKGTFAVYQVANAGWVDDEATYKLAESLHESLRGAAIAIDRTDMDVEDDAVENGEGDTTFDPNKM
jgi:hypothetical protein